MKWYTSLTIDIVGFAERFEFGEFKLKVATNLWWIPTILVIDIEEPEIGFSLY